MHLTMLFLLLTASLFGEDYYDTGIRFANDILKQNTPSQSVEKENLKKLVSEVKQVHPKSFEGIGPAGRNKCSISIPLSQESDRSLFVFVSFSMPDEAWIDISKQVEKTEGALILRGLPNNSFKDLAENIHRLRKLGVNATIKIEPRLFRKYDVVKVPSFVIIDGENFEKLSGNVTLPFALGKMKSDNAKKIGGLL